MKYTRKKRQNKWIKKSMKDKKSRFYTAKRSNQKKGKASACILKNKTTRYDPGYRDKWRGWYDVQKCGKCHDYCRWVGDSGPGGDPRKKTTRKVRGKRKSWWSCWLADASEGQKIYSSNKRWKKKFKYRRCSKEGIPPWDFKLENWIF